MRVRADSVRRALGHSGVMTEPAMNAPAATAADSRLSWARVLLVIALLVAAAGILVQFLTGVSGFPAVPPGPIILAATAIVVAVVRWRWIPGLGLLAAAFIAVGMIATFNRDHQFTSLDPAGPFIGAWLQLAGLLVSVVAGIASLAFAVRRSSRSAVGND